MIGAAEQTFPWEMLGGGSAALGVIAIVIWLTNKHSETTKAIASEFAATVKDANAKTKCLAETFTESTKEMAKESREAHERCQQMMQEMLRDQIPRRHRATDEHG